MPRFGSMPRGGGDDQALWTKKATGIPAVSSRHVPTAPMVQSGQTFMLNPSAALMMQPAADDPDEAKAELICTEYDKLLGNVEKEVTRGHRQRAKEAMDELKRLPACADYLLDNRQLSAATPGLGFRATAARDDLVPNTFAPWGAVVSGFLIDEDWVKIADERYLPVNAHGEGNVSCQVLTRLTPGVSMSESLWQRLEDPFRYRFNAQKRSILQERYASLCHPRGVDGMRKRSQSFWKLVGVTFVILGLLGGLFAVLTIAGVFGRQTPVIVTAPVAAAASPTVTPSSSVATPQTVFAPATASTKPSVGAASPAATPAASGAVAAQALGTSAQVTIPQSSSATATPAPMVQPTVIEGAGPSFQ